MRSLTGSTPSPDPPRPARTLPPLLALAALVAAGATACEPGTPREGEGERPAGTVRMAERLERIGEEMARASLYTPSVRVESLRAAGPPPDPRGRASHAAQLGLELLRAGDARESIERLRAARSQLGRLEAGAPARLHAAVRDLLGTAYLHLAMRENCLEGIGTPACLVPVPPDGRHEAREGARSAARVYRRLLASDPDNLGARWLLNIAHMMLGDYPGAIPRRLRIPPAAFEPEGSLPPFPDVAPELGLDVLGHAGGAAMDDFDGDGRLDLVVSSWMLSDQIRYFANRGDGTLEERTSEAGLEGITGGLNLVHADYDNDGCLDVLVLRGGWLPRGQPNSLLRNGCDGTFEDVTEEAGLLRPYTSTQTAAWADFDNDGWLDLFVGNESWGGTEQPSQLFRNEGDGTFTDVAEEAGAAVSGIVKAVVAGDHDDDGWVDLYLSRRGQPNVLLRNAGAAGRIPRFRDVTREAGVAEPIDSFTAWFWDYDNDGRLDLFVSGFRSDYGDAAAELLGRPHGSELPRLYRNEGDGSFSDRTSAVGLDRILFTMGANHGDLDNDGFEDFYVGTGDMAVRALVPNRAFRNDRGRRFREVTAAGGFGHIQKGHGVAYGDVDGDGDQDMYAVIGGAYEGDLARNVLFENPGNGNSWITLRLEGVEANRSAIGARVRLVVETEDGRREIHRRVGTGGSFGANSLQLEIGLGDAVSVARLEVRWPGSGRTDVYGNVEPDGVFRLREGAPEPIPVSLETTRPSERD